jgi:hypothetical protein
MPVSCSSDLDQIGGFARADDVARREWQPIATAPFDRDIEVAIIERGEAHSLAFPCRRTVDGWFRAKTRKFLNLAPTHWRKWPNPS